ncbi:MAG: hypothetical protein JNK63_08385 [Chthonomonas sp.]|nr:hypothetical protein [Chthonomonas sp.]
MVLTIHCGGQFQALWQGEDLGPPPTQVTGAMLLFLARTPGSWVLRSELGRRFFASGLESARLNSVRQTIFRLRKWLPEGTIETSFSQVRLKCRCQIILKLPNGEQATGPQIAPMLDHPWVDEFRASWSISPGMPAPHPIQKFGELVNSLADFDAETARQALASMPLLANGLPTDVLSGLLGKARPKRLGDSFSCEYEELRGAAAFRAGQVRLARDHYLRAFKIAKRLRDPEAMARTSSQVMFHLLELGDIDQATEWLSILSSSDRADSMRLLVLNAKATFFWNNGGLSEGLATMRSAEAHLRKATRVDRIHFLANYSVLLAEANELDGSQEVIDRARSEGHPAIDLAAFFVLQMAEAESLIRSREAVRAQELLRSALINAKATQHTVAQWYLREALSEAISQQDPIQGQRLWLQVEKERLAECYRLTPRVLMRRRRVMGSA